MYLKSIKSHLTCLMKWRDMSKEENTEIRECQHGVGFRFGTSKIDPPKKDFGLFVFPWL